MKPLKLELAGWGPYAKVETVDFMKIQDGSLFLVTGATGAGKTTIFDGITYALYGEVSGSIRLKDSLRSDFSEDDQDTYVTLLFLHKGKTYEVHRTPRYERKKKRGEGTVIQPEEAAFHDLSQGRIVTGATKVNQAIKEVLGIDYQQFKQLSMIAQGEFLRLLVADGNERTEVLRNIFNTHVYEELQKKASEQARQLGNAMKDIVARIGEVCQSLQGKEEIFEEALQGQQYETLLLLLNQRIKEEEKKEKEIKQALEAGREQREILLKQKELYEQQKKRKEELEQLKKEREYVKSCLQQAGERKENLIKQKEEIDKQKEEIQKRKIVYEALSEREDLQKQKEKVGKVIEHWEQQVLALKSNCDKRSEEIRCLQENVIKNAGVVEREKELNHRQKELERQKQQFMQLLQINEEKQQLKQRLSILSKQYQEAEKLAKESQNRYEEEETRYRHNILGIEAKMLEEGMECPLCGSKTHPKKATIADKPLSEEERKKLKKVAEEKKDEAQKIFGEGSQIQGNYVAKKEEFEKRLKEWNDGDNPKSNMAGAVLKEKQQQLDEEKTRWQQEMEAYLHMQMELEQKKVLAEKEEEQLEKIRQSHQMASKEYERVAGMEEQLQKKLVGFTGTKEEVEQWLQRTKDNVSQYEIAWNTTIEEVEKYQILLSSKQSLIADRERELLPVKEEEGNLIEEQLFHLMESNKRLEEQNKELSISLYTNRSAYDSIKEKMQTYTTLAQQYGIVGRLEQLFNGKNSDRLKLEQYVLSTYFDDILQSANIRFKQMSNERYELRRVERVADARVKNSLDIEVLDRYTGRRRSVKTLSGGEAFKAALSLALGLSDMIQNFAGGIEVDVLFVDEGFGSLDGESLNQAINCLLELTNQQRMIGIISHVPELKERIERQIEIVKGKEGSRILV